MFMENISNLTDSDNIVQKNSSRYFLQITLALCFGAGKHYNVKGRGASGQGWEPNALRYSVPYYQTYQTWLIWQMTLLLGLAMFLWFVTGRPRQSHKASVWFLRQQWTHSAQVKSSRAYPVIISSDRHKHGTQTTSLLSKLGNQQRGESAAGRPLITTPHQLEHTMQICSLHGKTDSSVNA